MKFNSLLAIVLIALSAAAPQTVLDRVKQSLVDAGFTVQPGSNPASDTPMRGRVILSNTAQHIYVDLRVGGWPGESQGSPSKQEWLEILLEGHAVPCQEATLFGVSLGEHCVAFAGSEGFGVQSICDRYTVDVRTGMKLVGTSQEIEARRLLIKTMCDRLARRLLGEAMATDLNDDGSLRSTAHLTGLEVNKAGMVPLATWAQSRGIAVSYDSQTEIASFTYHGKLVKLPLASGKAIVDGREVDLSGKFFIARGSRWFVPGQELADAIGWRAGQGLGTSQFVLLQGIE